MLEKATFYGSEYVFVGYVLGSDIMFVAAKIYMVVPLSLQGNLSRACALLVKLSDVTLDVPFYRDLNFHKNWADYVCIHTYIHIYIHIYLSHLLPTDPSKVFFLLSSIQLHLCKTRLSYFIFWSFHLIYLRKARYSTSCG